MTPPVPLPEALRVTHEAMHTTFTLHLIGENRQLAAEVARECFDLLDNLEGKLSRFLDGSDVFRINRLRAGETLYLSEPCHQCLLLAMQACTQTGGLFDITVGTRIEHLKSGAAGLLPPLAGRLIIHPDVAAITCEIPGREIDLGGIGKGFALDQMRDLLLDWGLGGALLAAGASTLLAVGPQPWPVALAGGLTARQLALTNQALSASGTDVQGAHIVHPSGEDPKPVYLSNRVWAVASTATLAEAWSTALMLMDPDEVTAAIAEQATLLQAYAELNGKVEVLKPSASCSGTSPH
ncbi:MAG: FAD:protein FMN transferase [Verrucomicrobia bacterium]|nr:FAD:protein FMN transferase [Verrucomicrobiota bacterium]